jgi:hypothetical protein
VAFVGVWWRLRRRACAVGSGRLPGALVGVLVSGRVVFSPWSQNAPKPTKPAKLVKGLDMVLSNYFLSTSNRLEINNIPVI